MFFFMMSLNCIFQFTSLGFVKYFTVSLLCHLAFSMIFTYFTNDVIIVTSLSRCHVIYFWKLYLCAFLKPKNTSVLKNIYWSWTQETFGAILLYHTRFQLNLMLSIKPFGNKLSCVHTWFIHFYPFVMSKRCPSAIFHGTGNLAITSNRHAECFGDIIGTRCTPVCLYWIAVGKGPIEQDIIWVCNNS